MKKSSLVLLITLLLFPFFSGCDSLEEAVANAAPMIPEGYEVLHILQQDDHTAVVFYTFQDDLSVGIFIKDNFGWTWTGSDIGKLKPQTNGLEWRYADLGDKNKILYSLYYGKVTNEDVTMITVQIADGETIDGEIVTLEDGALWFAFVPRPQEHYTEAVISGIAGAVTSAVRH